MSDPNAVTAEILLAKTRVDSARIARIEAEVREREALAELNHLLLRAWTEKTLDQKETRVYGTAHIQ